MMKTFISIALLAGISFAVQSDELSRADQLFGGRDNTQSLDQAITIADKIATRNVTDYEALWRLSKFRYYRGDRETDKAKKVRLFEAGADAARKAIQVNDKRVEGHFWLAANVGELADMKGAFESLGMVKTIRREFESALAIDPTYENGASYLALGQMYLSLPRLIGGSDRRGLEMLENGYKSSPTNAELKLALAERYMKQGRREDATKLLDSVLATQDPLRSLVEQEDLRAKAKQALARIK